MFQKILSNFDVNTQATLGQKLYFINEKMDIGHLLQSLVDLSFAKVHRWCDCDQIMFIRSFH